MTKIYEIDIFVENKNYNISEMKELTTDEAKGLMRELPKTYTDWWRYSLSEVENFHKMIELGKVVNKNGLIIGCAHDTFNEYDRYILIISAPDEETANRAVSIFMGHELSKERKTE